jgi:hypothetical protein
MRVEADEAAYLHERDLSFLYEATNMAGGRIEHLCHFDRVKKHP